MAQRGCAADGAAGRRQNGDQRMHGFHPHMIGTSGFPKVDFPALAHLASSMPDGRAQDAQDYLRDRAARSDGPCKGQTSDGTGNRNGRTRHELPFAVKNLGRHLETCEPPGPCQPGRPRARCKASGRVPRHANELEESPSFIAWILPIAASGRATALETRATRQAIQ